MKNALIITQMQLDYCDGGSLAHEGSLDIIPQINRIHDNFDIVIFANDCHPKNHCSFCKLPVHCVENTTGCEIHINLFKKVTDYVVSKGKMDKYDSESIFYEAEEIKKENRLKKILIENKADHLFFCGNGIDNCIFSSALDANNLGFKCYIIENMVTYRDKNKMLKSIKFLEQVGIKLIKL